MEELRKNQEVTIEITDIGNGGEGIGKINGMALFVKDAIIGDTARVKITKLKKKYGYARLMEVIEPSKDRVEPRCSLARRCGGCQIQEMSYERQLTFKEQKVLGNLERIGGLKGLKLDPIIGMEEPYHFRNKEQFPIRKGKDGKAVAGFFAARTHSLIEVKECPIGAPVNAKVMKTVLDTVNELGIAPYDEETHSGILRHVLIRYGFESGQVMVCLVINANQMPGEEILAERLSEIDGMTSITVNINKKKTNVILGSKIRTIWGQDYITDTLDGIAFQISPLSFYQVNPRQTVRLYRQAMEYAQLTGKETVWDLYCGIGTISLFLSRKAKQVYGVEIVPQAIEDAKRNAALNRIENVNFFVGKAEEVVPSFYKEMNEGASNLDEKALRPDVMVVDPPRKGCDEALLETMVLMAPERIVYVSCDSATLARDLKYLSEHGYEFVKGRAVDQFGHSVHVECVVLMSRADR
ncbi:23S rRNA (uracil(1939)-C(5))-methyltransferase RlmD [Eubacterium oxidoreducens]|uniref:23S rRNA m(5)U-1939 methyltransferase n=1 Tax=Eubacterium oxidoreducens TaxID=1732 RepID=A0A1G6CFQ0_EUBOX|nr:23S rRNA (uracil(1939)-C(5))-methyltransferase RlmD [Eubacterium oxidoreducens]SDB31717.1 23S rRNA m(5)U-1939 methyltransferase [Eubacterium oxidoreducens]